MEQNDQNIQRMNDDEIDLADLLRQIWAGRWIILITTVVFIMMAIIYLSYNSYTGIKEYESQTTLLVESFSPDSLITATRSPLFISEVLKVKLTGLKMGSQLTVAEVLDQQTKPPQGNLAGLTNRINATKGNAGIVVITVKMQDPLTVKQLSDSVVQNLIQFVSEVNVNKANEKIQILAEHVLKNLQFLTEGFQSAESKYFQAQKALSDFYHHNSKNLESIDSIEVKRLNADIKMKYNFYSTLYQQLEQAKIDARKQLDEVRINDKKILLQTKIDFTKLLDQVPLDSLKKVPVIKVLEPATNAILINAQNKQKILLLTGIFGIIVGICIVFGKKFWEKNFKKKVTGEPGDKVIKA